MQGSERRQAILEQLKASEQALSANKLATAFQVSRQISVGDIALLRASGLEIVATSKGYILPDVTTDEGYLGVVVCKHGLEQTQQELQLILELGGEVLDVSVEH